MKKQLFALLLATTGLTTIITAMEQAEPIQHLVTTGRQADTQLAQAILRGNLAHVQTLLVREILMSIVSTPGRS